MTEPEFLPHAPIQEAVLDIRVEFERKPGLQSLEALHETEQDRYPTKKVRQQWEASIEFRDGVPGPANPKGGATGYLCEAADGSAAFQARQDGFSYNSLKRYPGWDVFSAEAKRLWVLYRAAVEPKSVVRIALRYINRIELPLPLGDFKEYFLTTPEISPSLPQGLAQFLMRLVIPWDEVGGVAILTQTIVQPEGGKAVLPFILDIDVSKMVNWDAGGEDVMWDEFEKLRRAKNRAFFGSITEKTKGMCR